MKGIFSVLLLLSVFFATQSFAQADITAPVLLSLQVSTTTVDLSSGEQTIEFTIEAEDDTGVDWGYSTYVVLRSPGGAVNGVRFSETEPHTGELTITPDQQSGLWSIAAVSLQDELGNSHYLNRSELDVLGVPSFISVLFDGSNAPDLAVKNVSSPAFVFAGEEYSPTIRITNTSVNPSGEISLKITSEHAAISSISSNGGATACSIRSLSLSGESSGTGTCKLSGLEPMASREISVTMTAGYRGAAQLLVEAYTELPDSSYADNLLSITTIVLGNDDTVPQPPRISSIEEDDGALRVHVSPGGDGGSEIISFTVSCNEHSMTAVQSPIRVSGLENGVSYSCSATARNLLGRSAASETVIAVPQAVLASGLDIIVIKAALDAKSKNYEENQAD